MALRANVSSCTISSLISEIIFTEPSAFFNVKLYFVPFLPRISFTASVNNITCKFNRLFFSLCHFYESHLPLAILLISRQGFRSTMLLILIFPSSYCSDAPIPKKRPLISSSKYLLSTGGKNSVCGSIVCCNGIYKHIEFIIIIEFETITFKYSVH